MASAVDKQPAAARLAAVAAARCLPTATRGSQNSYTTSGDTTGTKLQEYPFPVCSPAEQAEIVRILDSRLEAADKLGAEIDAALVHADALRQSVLRKAFAGQLVPQDPDDEPASALLKRIQAGRARAPVGRRRAGVAA